MANPINLIYQDHLVELTKSLVSIPSITGQEYQLADWMVEHF